MTLTRRKFIQIGGAAAGGAALASGLTTRWWGLDADRVEDPATDGDRVVASYCELCFWGCGVRAHVKDGRVTKVVGNPDHPLSRGMLCPRGAGATGLLYDPDRLRRPLVRTQKRGEDVFEEVSWDAALNRVGEGLLEVKRRHGPEAVALFTHGSGGTWFKHFMKAWGSPNVGAPSYAQCRGPREAGYLLTFGTPLGSPEPIDLANARVITLIGSHLGENMHNTQVQDLAEAVGRGAELVVVDPRFSVAASKARYWLPIKPGTDIALLLAWMNVMLAENAYDAEYLAKHAVGLEELRAHVADKTPEWAYPITGLRPELIRDSARLIASARPASLVHPGRHTTWYGDDTQRARAMAILSALLGSWGRRGGYVSHAKLSLPPYPVTAEPPHGGKGAADRPKKGGFPVATEVIASGLCDASVSGQALYDLKAWLIYGCNLMQALPDRRQTVKALEGLDLVVSIDVLPAEICGWSDVVLPEATYLERDDDIAAPAYKRPFLAVRQEVVPPLHDSKPGWWIAKELAGRVGLAEHFPWKDAREYVDARLRAGGHDVARARETGVVLGREVATCEEEGLAVEVPHESGKIQLRSEELAKLGFDPLPQYYPHEEPPPGQFRLLMGRAPTHTFGRTVNNRLLAEPYPENEVWVNADVARALPGFAQPLEDGERVFLVNQDGARSGPVRAKVTQRIRGDCVYLVHGWGQTAKRLGYAYGRGASDSALVTRYAVDPIMGGTGMSVNFVRLERAERSA
ncbi:MULTISPECIES: molybdopterin-dependent oxidoreductase [Anaeromyxobacter]|uniref:molybdopterin-containing oxidoreductase family protein n=1 Tax=Anaeromyxobacter TaxID=161492 RepID=UPI001F5A2331|nr:MULTISPECIES: molybdopterin-dependent oxidoreductase [unclassified Anaeromyxobacter]